MKKILFITIILFLTLNASAELSITPWTPLFEGIEHASGQTDSPRLQKVQAIRIDLQEESIEFCTTPSNGSSPGDTNRQTALQFLNSSGAQVAVNTHFYETSAEIEWNANLIGLSMNQGQIVSEPEDLPNGGKSLLISKNNRARFLKTRPTSDLSNFWTAIEAWPYLLASGNNIGDPYSDIHPRTAIGLSPDRRYLIIITIDGRQPGYSEGTTHYETAEWLKRFGAYNGLNLDGGGSTHLWVSDVDGGKYPLNSPSENRAVGCHLGIYANYLELSDENYIYADFENGFEANFTLPPGYSGSTYGIDTEASTSDSVNTDSVNGDWSQRLHIVDDRNQSGGWFVRHLSGSSASRSENAVRNTTGYVGFWAKTDTEGCFASIAIDNTYNTTADRGNFREMPADGQWHLYQWNLEDDNDWHGWVNGNGIIDTVDFTIDSIQFTGADRDADIYIDDVAHGSVISLEYLHATAGDFQPDGIVNLNDFAILAQRWMVDSGNALYDDLYDISIPRDNSIDIKDIEVLLDNWLKQ